MGIECAFGSVHLYSNAVVLGVSVNPPDSTVEQVKRALEETFGLPVFTCWGMLEILNRGEVQSFADQNLAVFRLPSVEWTVSGRKWPIPKE